MVPLHLTDRGIKGLNFKYEMSADLLCVDTVRSCPPYLFGPASSLTVAQLCVAKTDDLIDQIAAKLKCA